MAGLKVGDEFPSGVIFKYVPYTEETKEVIACGVPQDFDISADVAAKKVLIVSVPGAFTPTCSAQHLPGYLRTEQKFKQLGFDKIIFIAFNDAWVMSAWGKASVPSEKLAEGYFAFMSDPGAAFSSSISWSFGERTARYAIAVDKGKVIYAAREAGSGVNVSGADAVLAKL